MTPNTILELIDAEITKLEQVRSILGGIKPTPTVTNPATSPAPRGRRTMSAEGRAKIAAAQRKRWAAVKRSAK